MHLVHQVLLSHGTQKCGSKFEKQSTINLKSGRDGLIFQILPVSSNISCKESSQCETVFFLKNSLHTRIFQRNTFSGTAKKLCEDSAVHSRGKSAFLNHVLSNRLMCIADLEVDREDASFFLKMKTNLLIMKVF